MLSPDGRLLLFSSDRPGGAGRHDLYTARAQGRGFVTVAPLAGAINTAADEFDASFLADSRTLVFARAPSMRDARVDLFAAALRGGRYDAGMILRSEEHTSELQSLMRNSYAVFCLKKKQNKHRSLTEVI